MEMASYYCGPEGGPFHFRILRPEEYAAYPLLNREDDGAEGAFVATNYFRTDDENYDELTPAFRLLDLPAGKSASDYELFSSPYDNVADELSQMNPLQYDGGRDLFHFKSENNKYPGNQYIYVRERYTGAVIYQRRVLYLPDTLDVDEYLNMVNELLHIRRELVEFIAKEKDRKRKASISLHTDGSRTHTGDKENRVEDFRRQIKQLGKAVSGIAQRPRFGLNGRKLSSSVVKKIDGRIIQQYVRAPSKKKFTSVVGEQTYDIYENRWIANQLAMLKKYLIDCGQFGEEDIVAQQNALAKEKQRLLSQYPQFADWDAFFEDIKLKYNNIRDHYSKESVQKKLDSVIACEDEGLIAGKRMILKKDNSESNQDDLFYLESPRSSIYIRQDNILSRYSYKGIVIVDGMEYPFKSLYVKSNNINVQAYFYGYFERLKHNSKSGEILDFAGNYYLKAGELHIENILVDAPDDVEETIAAFKEQYVKDNYDAQVYVKRLYSPYNHIYVGPAYFTAVALHAKEKALSANQAYIRELGNLAQPVTEMLEKPCFQSVLALNGATRREKWQVTQIFTNDVNYRTAANILRKLDKETEFSFVPSADASVQKNTCDLYEYWILYKLLEVLILKTGWQLTHVSVHGQKKNREYIYSVLRTFLGDEGKSRGELKGMKISLQHQLHGSEENVEMDLYYNVRISDIFPDAGGQHADPNAGLLTPDYFIKLRLAGKEIYIILDAKYRKYADMSGDEGKYWYWLNDDIKGVCWDKYINRLRDYGVDVAAAFIIHCDDTIENQHDKYVDFGGNVRKEFKNEPYMEAIKSMFAVSGDNAVTLLPKHRVGAFYMRPRGRERENHTEKNIIAFFSMLMEHFLAANMTRRTGESFLQMLRNEEPHGSLKESLYFTCWHCGCTETNVEELKTSGGFAKYYITCPKCHEFWVKSHCYAGGHHNLVKHMFNYNAHRDDDNWFVVCPTCGNGD